MNKYYIIYETLQNKYDNGEISINEATVINNIAYNKYVVEMKTRADYRMIKWKKENDYDPKSNTINIYGNRVKFKYNKGSKKTYTIPESKANRKIDPNNGNVKWDSDETNLEANRAIFNARHSDSHKFILGHEKGHFKDDIDRVNNTEKRSNDIKQKISFVENERRNGKLPPYHDMLPTELRADDYGVKYSSPKAMKHWVKDEEKILDKKKNKDIIFDQNSKEDDKKIISDLENDEFLLKFQLRKLDPNSKEAKTCTEKLNKVRHSLKVLKSGINDHNITRKRVKDGFNMRIKSATDGKIKKRDIKK